MVLVVTFMSFNGKNVNYSDFNKNHIFMFSLVYFWKKNTKNEQKNKKKLSRKKVLENLPTFLY